MRFLTAGESHGAGLTAVIEGLPAGLALRDDDLNRDLARRQAGYGRGARQQIESDRATISAGVAGGRTTGAPLALHVRNRDQREGEAPLTVPRPGHADLAGSNKYALDDLRLVRERASARETAARVAVGTVARRLLDEFGIAAGSLVVEIGGVVAGLPDLPYAELWALAEASDVRCPDEAAAEAMRRRIQEAGHEGESLGGVFLVAATGVPLGLGSYVHWDRRLDARLAAAVMSVPAVKGVEIGPAFANARRTGTRVQDAIYWEGGRPVRRTNQAGGVEGGVSNGQPIVIRAAMKPIPTTRAPQPSVDLRTGEEVAARYQRADVCAVPAAAVVGEAMVAWVLAEALQDKIGGDSLAEMKAHWQAYRGAWQQRD
ncbi:MAG: chorismate synthase [Anaerolineae bacterium]|nr:chorismate synthase [Anaerolineae bacterium]